MSHHVEFFHSLIFFKFSSFSEFKEKIQIGKTQIVVFVACDFSNHSFVRIIIVKFI